MRLQVVLCTFSGRKAELLCIRPGYTSSDGSPARGFSDPRPTALTPHAGIPCVHRTARIQTGHDPAVAYSSARSIPSPAPPVYPYPARCIPAAVFHRTPGWPENQNNAPSGRISPGYAASDGPQFPVASAFRLPVLPYCGHGSGSSEWHRRRSVPVIATGAKHQVAPLRFCGDV